VGEPRPVSRRSVAEALVTVTIALSKKSRVPPDPGVLRQRCSPGRSTRHRDKSPAAAHRAALDWAERPRSRLPTWKTPRTCGWRWPRALRPGRQAAAGSTQRRKRSVFYNAFGYAVELGRLGSNPADRIQWTAPAVAASVDRGRRQPRPGRDRCWTPSGGWGQAGRALKAFFACFTTRRCARRRRHAPPGRPAPAEGRVGADRPVGLRIAGRAGLDRRGHRRQERGLKHPLITRPAPSHPPVLVGCSARTSKRFGTTLDGRVFQTARGASCRTPATTRSGTRPQEALTPPSTGHRLGAARMTLRTRRCRCG